MYNMEMKVEGTKLHITVDLSKKGTISASGKSNMIASSEGNISLENKPEVKIGLNIYTSVRR